MNKKQKKRKGKKKEEPNEEGAPDALESLFGSFAQPDMRIMALFGEIDEDKSAELVLGFLLMSQSQDESKKLEPIEFFISTYGGGADDMFAVYDVMTLTKQKGVEIQTYGLGKVMSAGVLLLASGTPGSRRIGRHCRVMLHSCNAGNTGDLHNLKNEMEAIVNLQDVYINALVNETNLTKKQLKKLLDRKVNVYLSAEEAIEYGIADKLI